MWPFRSLDFSVCILNIFHQLKCFYTHLDRSKDKKKETMHYLLRLKVVQPLQKENGGSLNYQKYFRCGGELGRLEGEGNCSWNAMYERRIKKKYFKITTTVGVVNLLVYMHVCVYESTSNGICMLKLHLLSSNTFL